MFTYLKKRTRKAFPASVILLILCVSVILSGCSQVPDQSGSDTQAQTGSSGAETGTTSPEPSGAEITLQQETEEEEMDEQRVIARYQAVQQAMIDKDIDTLDEIILDGTTFTHMSGKTQTKEEYFADIRDGRLDYQSYTMENTKIVIDGDEATLTSRVVLTANAYGAQGSWPFNVTAHLVRIDGEWFLTN